jgi:hypothetical protein
LNDRIANIVTRDAADYRTDSRTRHCSCDLPRARAVMAASGLADTEAGSRTNQRAHGGAANSAPSQLALLRTSA